MGLSGEQAAQRVLPLGSSDPEAVAEAADGVAELVRRLNHATFHRDALPWPGSAGVVAGRMLTALYGLEQLLTQLAARLEQLAGDPQLYHGYERGDQASAAHIALTAALDLREAAGNRAALTDPLRTACEHIGRLGLLQPGELR